LSQWESIEKLINQREFKRAEVMLAKLARQASTVETLEQAALYRAKLRLLMGRANEALSLLNSIEPPLPIKDVPEHAELLADIYFQRYEFAIVGFADKVDLQQAHDLYAHVLEHHPQYPNRGWVHYQLGRLLLISAQSLEAESHFRQALFQPSHIVTLTSFVYERLAYVALYEHRNPVQALTFIDKAIATYPSNEPRAWVVQSLILKSKICQYLDINQALSVAQEAHKLATMRGSRMGRALVAESWFTMADLASRSRGREKEVIEYVLKFLQLSRSPLGVDVTWSRAHEMLAESYFALKQYPQALAAYQTMLDFNPYYPWLSAVRLRIAECHFHMRQYHDAIRLCEELLSDSESQESRRARTLLDQALQATL
jgi:tetratricopeptide (TPR) repeat protein